MTEHIEITPRLIELKEITEKEYHQLKHSLGRQRPEREEPGDGFAEITLPLIFGKEKLEGVLLYFAQKMEGARRMSVEATPKKWTRISRRELTRKRIKDLATLLIKEDLTFSLDTHNRVPITDVNAEIEFELIANFFMSTRLSIPGERRGLYRWNGSNKRYTEIHAVYNYRKAKPI